MTTQHTITEPHAKGPWKAVLCHTIREHQIVNEKDGLVAIVPMRIKGKKIFSYVPHEGNARLIAAAPELLHACQMALQQLEGCKPMSGCHAGSLAADIRIVKEAIAKAKGQ